MSESNQSSGGGGRPSPDELKQKLTPEQYRVTQECGTEPPFTGKYYAHHETGTYLCVCCGQALFRSDEKFESGSGWPSFSAPFTTCATCAARSRPPGATRWKR